MERIFGIDLGTTNSLIAYSDNGTPRVIPDPETQSPLLPSVVAFPSANEIVVGASAKALATDPAADHDRFGEALHGSRHGARDRRGPRALRVR